MIVVRDIFNLHYGKARDVKALMQEMKKYLTPDELKNTRLLFDLVGPAYTMVWETTCKDLADWEAQMKTTPKPEFQDWYKRLVPFIGKGYREIFSIVE